MATPDIIVQVKGGKTTAVVSPAGGATRLVQLSDVRANTAVDGAVLGYVQANNDFEFLAGVPSADLTARARANGAFDEANAAYANANTAIYTAAQIRANISNTAPVNYDPSTGIISHADSGALVGTYGNTTFTPTITVDAKGHITSIVNTAIALPPSSDQFARDHANGAFDEANAAFDQANTANVTGQAAFDYANAIQLHAASVGPGQIYYLDSTLLQQGNNFSLRTFASVNAEMTVSATVIANTRFLGRFVSNTSPGGFDVAAGQWIFDTWAAVSATAGLTEIVTRVNKRVIQTTGTITSTGSGLTRTFTAYGASPFVSGDASTDLLLCSLIETPNETFSISTFTSGSVVTANITNGNTAYTNEDNVAFSIYYLLFPAVTTGDLSTTGVTLYTNTSTQQGFTLAATDKIMAAYFARTDSLSGKTPSLYFGGTQHYSRIETPITVPHNRLAGLQGGTLNELYHLTDAEHAYLPSSFAKGNSAYDQANIATTNADAAFTHSNAAFVLATTANTVAASAYNQANIATANADAAFARANAAYSNANTAIYTAAQIRANISNSFPVGYSSATGVISLPSTANGQLHIGNTVSGTFDLNTIAQTAPVIVVNDKGSITLSHASSGVTAKTYGNATLIPVITVDAFGHITAVSNVAGSGGTGLPASSANGQTLIGNTVSGSFDVATLTQGTGIVITNDKGSITIAATGGSAVDQYARDKANGAAQNSFVTVNVAGQSDIVADSNTDTLTIVGSGITITTNAGTDTLTIQHPASGVVASGYGDAATVPKFVVDANGHVTSVTNTAIAIAASQITSGTLVVARGGTGQSTYANGQILVGNGVSTGLDVTTIAQTAPVIVTNGKGTVTLSHASSGVVAGSYGDASHVAAQIVDAFGHTTSSSNVAIAIDAGAITSGTLVVARGGTGQSTYTNGQILIGNTGSTGLDKATIAQSAPVIVTVAQGSITISHARSGVTAVDSYGSQAIIPVFAVDANGHITAVVNTAIGGLGTAVLTTGILPVARGGTGKDATGLANGQLLIGNTVNTGFDLTTIAQTAPVIVVNGKGTITLSHASSGVVATGYGTLNQIPVLVVDAFGHVTSVTNTAIGSLDAGVITTGTLVVARGGTGQSTYTNGQILIGNTGSTGLDKATIAQSAPVIVTVAQGSITISHARSGVTAVDSYGSQAIIPVFAVDANGHITAVVNTAIGGLGTGVLTTGILPVARGGTGKDATGLANGQILIGNTVNTGFDLTTIAQTAPVIVVNGKGTITLSHASSGVAAAVYGNGSIIPSITVDAFGHITGAVNTAVAIDASQITTGTLVVARGGTGQSTYTNGQILIGNTGSTGLDKATIAQSAPVIVTVAQGSITISHARSGVTAVDSYGSQAIIPVFAVDANGHITAVVNTAIGGLGTGVLTTGILPVARGGTGKDATGLANGQILIGNTVNTGFDLAGITQTAPIIVSTDKGSIRLSHARSGVTAATYGSSSLIPVITVDDNGHVTTITTSAASGLPAATANGQLLIGNTVSSSFDVATLTQGSGIVITNDKGSITVAATGGAATDQFVRNIANAGIAFVFSSYAFAEAGWYTSWATLHAAYVLAGSPICTIGFATKTSADTLDIPAGYYPFTLGTTWKAVESDLSHPVNVRFKTGARISGVTEFCSLSLNSISASPAMYLDTATDANNRFISSGPVILKYGTTVTANQTPFFFANTSYTSLQMNYNCALNANTINVTGTVMHTIYMIGSLNYVNQNSIVSTQSTSVVEIRKWDNGYGSLAPIQGRYSGQIYTVDVGFQGSDLLFAPTVRENGQAFFDTTNTAPVWWVTNTWRSLGSLTSGHSEIDFGSTPVSEGSFTITDSRVTATSNISGSVAYSAPTGKDLDELEFDQLNLMFGAAAGSISLYVTPLNYGLVAGKFIINYTIG